MILGNMFSGDEVSVEKLIGLIIDVTDWSQHIAFIEEIEYKSWLNEYLSGLG